MANIAGPEMRRLSELRAVLDSLAARHAAANVADEAADHPEQIEHLQNVLKRLVVALQRQSYTAFRTADYQLHAGIVDLAAVPQLRPAWEGTWKAMQRFHAQTFEHCFPDARFLAEEHEYLIETIKLGDAAAAEDAARSHVEAVWLRLAEQQRQPVSSGAEAVQRAAAHLAFGLARSQRLEDVAANVAFTSPGHLSRLFRQHYGLSFQAYLQKLRLEKAAELLRTTRLPVSRVARRVGYHDCSRFAQHFKRMFQTTPTRFQRAADAKTAPAAHQPAPDSRFG